MSKIRILIADDHAIFRDGLRTLLGSYDDIDIVGEACEGRECIKKVQECSPDVVLMDTGMPGMDGLEATRRIRKQNPTIKVLALTQYEDKKYVLSVIKAGVAGCISKRATSSELVTAIRTVYGGNTFLCPCATKVLYGRLHPFGEVEAYDSLTARERETLKLISEGYTSKKIAEMLDIEPRTVHEHRLGMRKKLGLRNTAELVKYAADKRLLNMGTEKG